MDPRMIPKGGSDEEFTDLENRRNPNPAGVYYHPGANKFLETGGLKMPDGSISHDQLAGTIQGDAFAQIGFKPANDEQKAYYEADQKVKAELNRIKQSRKTFTISAPRS
jgi:hypothetical protein